MVSLKYFKLSRQGRKTEPLSAYEFVGLDTIVTADEDIQFHDRQTIVLLKHYGTAAIFWHLANKPPGHTGGLFIYERLY